MTTEKTWEGKVKVDRHPRCINCNHGTHLHIGGACVRADCDCRLECISTRYQGRPAMQHVFMDGDSHCLCKGLTRADLNEYGETP